MKGKEEDDDSSSGKSGIDLEALMLTKELEFRVELMKKRINERADVLATGIREEKIFHGLKLSSSVSVASKMTDICYCTTTKEYLLLDPAHLMVFRYNIQGKPIEPSFKLSPLLSFQKFLWCEQEDTLVCYTPRDDTIWATNSKLALMKTWKNDFRLDGLFYEPVNKELIVVGDNRAVRYELETKELTMKPIKGVDIADPEITSTWKAEHFVMIPLLTSNAEYLRMAVSWITAIYIFSLEMDREVHPVGILQKSPNATITPICALAFVAKCNWIITAEESGTVRGWDLQLECVMDCPRAHDGNIKSITAHPVISGFMTLGSDNVLQLWSCKLKDKTESFTKDSIGRVDHVIANPSTASVATVGKKLICYLMHQIYIVYATLTGTCKSLTTIYDPRNNQPRVLASTDDNVARIYSANSGSQITAQILTLNNHSVQQVAYSTITKKIYTIMLETGEISVSDAEENPAKFECIWVNNEVTITCLVVYDCHEDVRGLDGPTDLITSEGPYIFVGTKCGLLLAIEEESGSHRDPSKIKGHEGPVLSLHLSTSTQCLYSFGIDRCVKIWRLLPKIPTPLVLVHTVYFVSKVLHIATIGHTLCAVEMSANNKISMHDTRHRIRYGHIASKDHTDRIIDVTCSESLEIAATSSDDKTIRIWSDRNELLKLLEINAIADFLTFSSLRCDIVFSAGKHLYRLPYENYLSPLYQTKINNLHLPVHEDQVPISIDEDYQIYSDEIDDWNSTLNPVPMERVAGEIKDKSQMLDSLIREQFCDKLRARDEDIENLKMSLLRPRRLVKKPGLMTRAKWEYYFTDLLASDTRSKLPGALN